MNTIPLYAFAVLSLMLATVALAVLACEWRARRRKAEESAALQRGYAAYVVADKEQRDSFLQSCSTEQREKHEKWMQEIKEGPRPVDHRLEVAKAGITASQRQLERAWSAIRPEEPPDEGQELASER